MIIISSSIGISISFSIITLFGNSFRALERKINWQDRFTTVFQITQMFPKIKGQH